jgi:hypothetical protein
MGWCGGGVVVQQVLIHLWIDYGSRGCMYCSLYDIFRLGEIQGADDKLGQFLDQGI